MSQMPLRESMEILHAARVDEIVVTTMGPAREWMEIGPAPHDFVLVPSSMGQASSFALGLALAQPDRGVVVCNGDGSLLMNLGSLVTITAQSPPNLTHILCDNGMYEVTGQQETPATAAARRDNSRIDFAAVARACGFSTVLEFGDLEEWRTQVGDVLAATGPKFVLLRTAPIPGAVGPRSPAPGPQRVREFAAALQG